MLMVRSARTKRGSSATSRILAVLGAVAGLTLMSFPVQAGTMQSAARARAPAASAHMTVHCGTEAPALPIQCPDVYNPEATFGHYVGHDEPGVWDYSNVPGSGNRARWTLHLPTDPPPNPVPGADSYSFQQHVAFWFGMSLCASQSYPEQTPVCKPDSDSNIVNPKVSPDHPGSAYLELQFYPPGYTVMPSGISCDATQWCAAMNVWSFYQNPVTGQNLNKTCQSRVGGVELDNFAFVTLDGKPTGPPDPLHSTLASFTPDSDVLFMNQGDTVGVTVKDSHHGLRIMLNDQTSHQAGTMTASAANGFAQMDFAPNPSTRCTSTPYTFHPEYSTSSIKTRTTWTAFPYNIAWSDETGHFDDCSQVTSSRCTGLEGPPGDQEAADGDDTGCSAPSQASLDRIGGCIGENDGFDGTSYQDDWPNGQPNRPTPIEFSGPLTGRDFTVNYQRTALVAPMPFNEHNQPCNVRTRTGCTNPPVTDDGTPAAFYPYFYTTPINGCTWGEGTDVPGLTVNDFGKDRQYGTYDRSVYYTGRGGTAVEESNVFMHTYAHNLCRARPSPGGG
ncbi:MAG: hypothetical protein J2P25_23015 [Nocardiopsaceae bacterium]|nr:hypothetical protein [Nocardiopsaceae bacterium]